MAYLKFLPICFMLFFAANLQGQSTIVLFDDNTPFSGECIELSLGQSVTFIEGSLCGPTAGDAPAISILFPDGNNILVNSDTTIVLDQLADDMNPYVISCNTPADIGLRSFQTAACITVAENVVPTVVFHSLCLSSVLAQ